nr:MAG TPA: hypothetical protein [Caudoviricetes sp.]
MRDIIILSYQIKPVFNLYLIYILPQIYLQKIVHFILREKYLKYTLGIVLGIVLGIKINDVNTPIRTKTVSKKPHFKR